MFNILTYKQLFEQQNIGSFKIPLPEVYPSSNYAGKWTDDNYNRIVGQVVSFNDKEKEIKDIYSDSGNIFFVDKETNVHKVGGQSVEIKNNASRVFNKLDPYGEEVWESVGKEWLQFINEAHYWDVSPNDYIYCTGNLGSYTTNDVTVKAVIKCKGKYAKILKRDYVNQIYRFLLEFETPVETKDENKRKIEITTFSITQNQTKNLMVIKSQDYERWKAGNILPYKSTAIFDTCIDRFHLNMPYRRYDASYFDIDVEKNDVVSYLPANKANLVVDIQNGNALPNENPYASKYRQSTKVGRIIKKLNDKLTDSQVEEVVTKYKASWNYYNRTGATFIDVVTGDKIAYWYDSRRYAPGQGTLNHSCMRDPSKSYRIQDFYGRHPDKIALCILIDVESQTLLARALVWKLDVPEGKVFMDRIYYVKPEHEKIIENYAKKHGMFVKISNDYPRPMEINISHTPERRNGENITLPYLDTFQYIYSKEKLVLK